MTFDEQRREWEFEKLREEHGDSCAGAFDLNGWWVVAVFPVLLKDGSINPNFRAFD